MGLREWKWFLEIQLGETEWVQCNKTSEASCLVQTRWLGEALHNRHKSPSDSIVNSATELMWLRLEIYFEGTVDKDDFIRRTNIPV
jgi:hypothetical protein